MLCYVCLIQCKDQGTRNIQDTVKRADAAMAEAKKMGMKIVEEFWTMGAYDGAVIIETPDVETMNGSSLRLVHLISSKPKPCARFAGTRCK